MRILFFLLLVGNALIFSWYYFNPVVTEVAAVPIPANTKSLVLLGEVDKAALTKKQTEEEILQVEAVKPVTVAPEPDQCFTVGPFREELQVNAFRDAIKRQVLSVGIRQRVEKQHWAYLVYLPDPGGKKKAVAVASDLAKKGVKDYYVISKGEHKNGISLGHFKDKKLAESRLKNIGRMKYKPLLESVYKDYNLYWLDYKTHAGEDISQQVLNQFDPDDTINQLNRECR